MNNKYSSNEKINVDQDDDKKNTDNSNNNSNNNTSSSNQIKEKKGLNNAN